MTTKTLHILHQEILQWYGVYGRKALPWRNLTGENAPYGVYVSEIMLQQTQVSTVLGKYYEPFLNAFPTLQALAGADENAVLLLWRGLGYYSRARNMLKTARICGKYLPDEPKELMRLPGIGAYSAGAIACFGFGKAVAFVDGNIRRVLLRFFALEMATPAMLQSYAEELLNVANSFDHNQALLDIGANVCTKLAPKCEVCPLQKACKGKDNPSNYLHRSKITYEAVTYHLGVCIQDGKIALVKSNDSAYRGLYNFPKILDVRASGGIVGFPLIGVIKHSYTRYRLSLNVYLCPCKEALAGEIAFFTAPEVQDLAVSAMVMKVLDLLEEKGIWRAGLVPKSLLD
ncbi:A/G-specific adenine glycosylase [Helicobacter sp. 11S02596-1]|uniref:A/G-specific adenine glycosylase n=1 Tax=Helicobacter sp. 11S02596-1 TaxID=1476194 RepID=UPI000BA6964A|nr:A/G-specific adenine glycosylase [Helicobacter sp. 11S02596-1]PAF42819.1 hypothetical protein BJI48_06085 [Helicobacter sp. 11S02596-1]